MSEEFIPEDESDAAKNQDSPTTLSDLFKGIELQGLGKSDAYRIIGTHWD